jgi:hypothetical protein
MATWNARNLARHHKERLRKDPGCFEDLMGIAGRTITESQYKTRSHDAIDNAWGEYEGEWLDKDRKEFLELRAYFVDNDLVVAITDSFRKEFVTCFHAHFNYPHGRVPGPGATTGQKQLRYIERLKRDEQGGYIRRVKRIRGF